MGTLQSQDITDLKASPPKLIPVGRLGGRIRVAAGTLEAAVGDLDAADIFLLARLPTIARVVSIVLWMDDMTSGATLTFDVELYNLDGTIKGAGDHYGTAAVNASSPVNGSEVAFEARNIDKMGQQVWQDAGDAADPGGYYDLGLTVAASSATLAPGTISWRVLYTVD